MSIRGYRGKTPQIAATAYIDPSAQVIGDVVIGERSSVWPNTTVRGDVNYIRIGDETNVQDNCCLHVQRDEFPLILGNRVSIAHSVTLESEAGLLAAYATLGGDLVRLTATHAEPLGQFSGWRPLNATSGHRGPAYPHWSHLRGAYSVVTVSSVARFPVMSEAFNTMNQ